MNRKASFNQWWQLGNKNTQALLEFQLYSTVKFLRLIFICEQTGKGHLQKPRPDRMVKSTPRSLMFPPRSHSLNVGIELWGWGAPEWCLCRGGKYMRLAKAVFDCLWREVYVVACLRRPGSSIKSPGTPAWLCVRTQGRLWRVCLNDTAASVHNSHVSSLKPTWTAVSAEDLKCCHLCEGSKSVFQ